MFGIGKKFLIAAAGVAALACGRAAMADTITVNYQSATDVNIGGTEYADYQYEVTFDTTTDLDSAQDGFMVVDFGPLAANASTLTGYTLTDDSLDSSIEQTDETALAAQFTESNQGDATGLLDFAGNSGNQDTFTDPLLGTHVVNDNEGINNVVFFYKGTIPEEPSLAFSDLNLTLNLYTLNLGTPSPTSIAFGADQNSATGDNDLTFEPTDVPPTLPLPSSAYAGGALIGLVMMGRFVKARRELVA
jgi:hypothetical protein